MNLLSVRGLTIDFVSAVLSYTDHMKELVTRFGGDDRLKRKVIALLFCEPSTRTRCSFQAAVQRLGGSVILVEGDGSSMKKGETLQDTTQTLACYCDLIVIRHPEKGSAQTAAQHSRVPVINAGKHLTTDKYLLFHRHAKIIQTFVCNTFNAIHTKMANFQVMAPESTQLRPCWTCIQSKQSWGASGERTRSTPWSSHWWATSSTGKHDAMEHDRQLHFMIHRAHVCSSNNSPILLK